MDQIAGTVQEFSWHHAGRKALNDSIKFAAANVHTVSSKGPAAAAAWNEGWVRTYSAGGFTLLHSQGMDPVSKGQPALEIRDAQAISGDGRDRFGFLLQLSGARRINQLGRRQLLSPGTAGFICTSEPYVIETEATERIELVAFYMPSEYVDRQVIDGKQLCSATGSSLDRLASETLKVFSHEAWAYNGEEFLNSSRIIADLILLSLEAPRDRPTTAQSLRRAQIARVKRIIRHRMAQFDLTLADIADAADLSLSYVHRLFRDEGITLGEYLKAERLRSARDMLRVAAAANMTVTDVSLSCGFSDSSHFSRCFKKAFGSSPVDLLRLGRLPRC